MPSRRALAPLTTPVAARERGVLPHCVAYHRACLSARGSVRTAWRAAAAFRSEVAASSRYRVCSQPFAPSACTLQSTGLGFHVTIRNRENAMLYWAAVFFIIALLAAFFGFGGLAAGAAGIAKILFFVFLVFAVISLVLGRRAPT